MGFADSHCTQCQSDIETLKLTIKEYSYTYVKVKVAQYVFNSYQRKRKYAVHRIYPYVKILVTLANNDVIKTNIS